MERGYFLPFLISFPVHIHIETCVWQDADRHGHRAAKPMLVRLTFGRMLMRYAT